MGDYFRDDFQGVGAVAAARPAPKAAPAPSVRPARAGGRIHRVHTGCPSDRWLRHPARPGDLFCDCMGPPLTNCVRGGGIGAIGAFDQRNQDGGGGGAGGAGGTAPPPAYRVPIVKYRAPAPRSKPPVRQGQPGRPRPALPTSPTVWPVRSKPPIQPAPVVSTVTTTTTLPPGTTSGGLPAPIKTQTAWGGGGGAIAAMPGGEELAPDREPTAPDDLQVSAMPGGLPAGAGKFWLVAGVGTVAYLGYRLFFRRRRR